MTGKIVVPEHFLSKDGALIVNLKVHSTAPRCMCHVVSCAMQVQSPVELETVTAKELATLLQTKKARFFDCLAALPLASQLQLQSK
jgi:hypothetical protein